MNTQTQEALKMAIEFIDNVHEGEWLYVGFDREDVINACKEALEQPAQTYIVNNTAGTQFRLYEQPAQENCAHIGMDKCPHKGICQYCKQPAQEPVAWIEVIDHHGHKTSKVNLFDKGLQLADGTNLYTHPHQWQGLTDDEIWDVANSLGQKKEWDYPVGFARAIEQALRIKNGA